MPADLYERLERAIRTQSISQLEAELPKLADLGEQGERLAAHLSELKQALDAFAGPREPT